jgi:sarcosine oxidase subunit gamma
MSDAQGFYRGLVDVTWQGPRGMITLRGDMALIGAAAAKATGADAPGQRQISGGKAGHVAWMSPDELLIVAPDAAPLVAKLDKALAGEFALVADVSDARAVFTIKGAQARDVLAKIAPVDFADFTPGTIRRTRAAQVAAAIWCDAPDSFTLVCFRSVGQYMWDLLRTVAQPGGEVGLYRA